MATDLAVKHVAASDELPPAGGGRRHSVRSGASSAFWPMAARDSASEALLRVICFDLTLSQSPATFRLHFVRPLLL